MCAFSLVYVHFFLFYGRFLFSVLFFCSFLYYKKRSRGKSRRKRVRAVLQSCKDHERASLMFLFGFS